MSARKGPDGRSSVHQTPDGRWHGWVSFGVDPSTGKRRRRHVQASTKSEVAAKVKGLEHQRDDGYDGGPRTTVGEWVDVWVRSRALVVRPSTIKGYRTDVRRIRAGIGMVRLDKLTPEHVEGLYRRALDDGLSPGSVAHLRRTLSAALAAAVDRGRLSRNPARMATAPSWTPPEVVPLTPEEAKRVLAAATSTRNGARWSVALALGLRQGEALGLRWSDVNLDAGTVAIRHQLVWRQWRHGCAPAGEPPACRQKGDPSRTNDPGRCPQRVGGGPALTEPKSASGRRTLRLPAPLVAELRAHRTAQQAERLAAGSRWQDWDLVFAGLCGEPLQTRTDWEHWCRLLDTAGVRRVRLHDARHTATTLLLLQGVSATTASALLGHSDPA